MENVSTAFLRELSEEGSDLEWKGALGGDTCPLLYLKKPTSPDLPQLVLRAPPS